MEMRQTKKLLLKERLTYIEAIADNAMSDEESLPSRSLDPILRHLEIIKNSNRVFYFQTAFEQNRMQLQLIVVSSLKKNSFS